MSTVLFFTACLTISKFALALNIPLGQYATDSKEPLEYMVLPNQLPSYTPVLNNDNKLGEPNLQAPQQSLNNCPNLEILQNILILLKRLVEQDNDSQFLQPDKKLQVLSYLKKQFERTGPINNNISNLETQSMRKTNQELLLNGTSSRTSYQQMDDNPNSDSKVEAQLLLKYSLPATPNAGCKEVLAALIQAVNTAHSQLVNFCKQSGKCNVGEVGNSNVQLKDLPRILNDIISTSQPQVPQHQLEPAKSINIYDIQKPPQSNNFYNDAIQKELYNDYLKRLIQNYNIDIVRNKQETIDRVLNNIGDKTKMNIFQNLLKFQQNKAGNSVGNANQLSSDALIKLYQILKDRSTSSVASNQLKSLNYNVQKPLQSYIPGNLLQPNPNIIGNVELNAVYPYNQPRNDKTNQLLNPNFNIQERKDLSSAISGLTNLHSNSYKAVGNQFKLSPIVRLNPYEQQYFADYLKRDIQSNTLVDSQRESVSNLLKLNSAPDNGVVELTYKLKHPQSLLKNRDDAFYYVKYRMPYQTFMAKVLESMRSPQLRSNPAKLYEELLSVSNLVELSSDLKDVEHNDLTKVITNNGAMLVSARVLSTNTALDDEYIKILQKLNANLNTNDIVNLVNNENINKGPSNDLSDLKDANIQNDDKLPGQNLDKQNIVQLLSPVQTSVNLSNDNARKAYINTLNPAPGRSPIAVNPRVMYNIVPGLTPNAVNPQVMYNTLLNSQSFSPFTFQTTPSPNYLLG